MTFEDGIHSTNELAYETTLEDTNWKIYLALQKFISRFMGSLPIDQLLYVHLVRQVAKNFCRNWLADNFDLWNKPQFLDFHLNPSNHSS